MRYSPQALSAVLQERRLPAIDGLRAVAVGLVMAYHAGGPVPGDLGVSVFFVLSGFLITWLLLREHADGGTVDLRAFYLRRTLRIFPAYYVFLAFSFALDTLLGDGWSWSRIVTATTYTVNYYNAALGHPASSVAHAWSLAVEEQFYLLWPLAFLALASRGPRAIGLGVGTAVIASAVWRSVGQVWLDFPASYAYNSFETRLDNLAVGCLAAVLARGAWFGSLARSVAIHPTLPFATIAALLASRMAGSELWHYTLGFTVDAVLITVLIVQLLQVSHHRCWSWLDHPATRYLGLLSYSLYLYHQWGLAIGHKMSVLPQWGQVGAGVLASIALAAGSHYAVERPFLALKRRVDRPIELATA
jgi:peptidoglycan/LPS O-acetylase OafA/YrhL